MNRLLSILLLSSFALTPAVQAETVEAKTTVSSMLEQRAQELVMILNDQGSLANYFTPNFLTAVPEAQFKAISASIIAQHGKALRVVTINANGPNTAVVEVEYERAIATIDLTIETIAPHRVAGLLARDFALKNDNLSKISSDFRSLPGRAGFKVQKLGSASEIAQINMDQQFAVGSVFKLYVLAELATQIEAGQRKWSDVVPLNQRAFSSSATQGWPRGAPVTLQTLATWMISVSDNAATDELINILGRDAVENKLASIGHSAPDKALPLLTTVEAFALKSNTSLRDQFEKATEAQQRDILEQEAAALSYDKIDLSLLGSGPVAIDTVEWSASPGDITMLLDHLHRIDSKTALDIMAVNKGTTPTSAARWRYLGYKGGSEPGVIAMSFLGQSKSGDWYAISGAWNNPAREVDNAAFAALMSRLVDSIAD